MASPLDFLIGAFSGGQTTPQLAQPVPITSLLGGGGGGGGQQGQGAPQQTQTPLVPDLLQAQGQTPAPQPAPQTQQPQTQQPAQNQQQVQNVGPTPEALQQATLLQSLLSSALGANFFPALGGALGADQFTLGNADLLRAGLGDIQGQLSPDVLGLDPIAALFLPQNLTQQQFTSPLGGAAQIAGNPLQLAPTAPVIQAALQALLGLQSGAPT